MQKIEMLFYSINPSEINAGLKFVLFEINTPESQLVYDWGFADWDGKQWGNIDTPEGFTCKVVRWANTVDPELLTKEKSKIITLGK